eukprot:1140740-Pelagomonas_calceolata.AAC.7
MQAQASAKPSLKEQPDIVVDDNLGFAKLLNESGWKCSNVQGRLHHDCKVSSGPGPHTEYKFCNLKTSSEVVLPMPCLCAPIACTGGRTSQKGIGGLPCILGTMSLKKHNELTCGTTPSSGSFSLCL